MIKNPESKEELLKELEELKLENEFLKTRNGQDIIERKRGEELLQRSQSSFRALYENAQIGLYRTNPAGTILIANKALVKMLGYPSFEKIAERNLEKDIYEPTYQRKEFLEKIEKDGEIIDFKSEWVRHDGSKFFARESAKAIRDSQGTTLYYDGVVEDISERKRAEEEVRESEERFRMIFENVFDGISIYIEDPDTSKRRLIECNEQYSALAGRSRDELLQLESKVGLQITLDNKGNVSRMESINRSATHQGYFSWIRPDGKENVVEYIGVPIKWRGKSCTIGIDRDVTEQKKIELTIKQQNKQLQELNSTKDRFFSIIAHDLRSPFHGFLGLTKMLAEEPDSYSTKELSQIGKDLNQSANNLFTLLKNLFDWAEMQKGSTRLRKEEFSLSGLISENVGWVKQRSTQKELKMINMVTNPVYVYADKNMISSVLSNLLWNAVKFTNRNGSVEINAKKNDNEMIEISVKDTGVGIGKRVIDNLFQLGEKTGRQGTDGELSTGLGLLLCKEFVEKNSGKIWVESEEGVGSTFYFTLPEKDGAFPMLKEIAK